MDASGVVAGDCAGATHASVVGFVYSGSMAAAPGLTTSNATNSGNTVGQYRGGAARAVNSSGLVGGAFQVNVYGLHAFLFSERHSNRH